MNNYLHNHKISRKLTTLIENRTVYTVESSELNIFETYQPIDHVNLTFNAPAIIGMLTGKKIMHFDEMPSFNFIPGESLVVPSGKELVIDFPDASIKNPTQCMVLTIEPAKINEITEKYNEHFITDEKIDGLALDLKPSHLINQQEINHLIQRLVYTFTNNVQLKDIIVDLMIHELIIRLLQTKARQILFSDINNLYNDSRIGAAVKHIKKHLTEKNITVESLADVACMSTSHFFKQFKNTLGVSPIDYINSERIKFAKQLLATEKNPKISDIAYKSGFNSVSYFNRQFKKHELMSPGAFLKALKEQF